MSVSYFDMINVVSRTYLMQGELPALEEAVAVATADMAKAEGLYKTVARCKLRDAENALEAKKTEIYNLGTSIPAPEKVPCADTIKQLACLRLAREVQKRTLERAKNILDGEQAKVRTGTWRPKGATLPLTVLRAQSEVEKNEEKMAELESEIKAAIRTLDVHERQRIEDAEVDAWIRGEGPRPRILVERDQREWEEFQRNAIRLPIRKIYL
jgi:hypothetical protein